MCSEGHGKSLTTDEVAQADEHVEAGPEHLGRDVGVLPQQQRLDALHGDLRRAELSFPVSAVQSWAPSGRERYPSGCPLREFTEKLTSTHSDCFSV